MSIQEIGCCGAYCGTCRVFAENICRGCKLGYENGKRDLSKSKCKMKVCCISKKHNSCADCEEYEYCDIIQDFHKKNGLKYKKYKEALDFIKTNGYDKFIIIADRWERQHGRFK